MNILPFLILLSPASAAPKKLPLPFRLRIPTDAPVPSTLAGKFLTQNPANTIWAPFMGSGLRVDISSSSTPAEFTFKPSSSLAGGEITEAGNATAPLWLRPTHGTPQFFVRTGGDPEQDAFPFLNPRADWRIGAFADRPGKMKGPDGRKLRYRLYYGWEGTEEQEGEFPPLPSWTACKRLNPVIDPDAESWKLFYGYYGSVPEDPEACTMAFDLEAVF